MCELRWKNGKRIIYYAEIPKKQVILIGRRKQKWSRQRHPPGKENLQTDTSRQMRKLNEIKKRHRLRQSNPREELMGRAVWECLNGDSEGVIEVIRIYLEAVNITQIAKENDAVRVIDVPCIEKQKTNCKNSSQIIHTYI